MKNGSILAITVYKVSKKPTERVLKEKNPLRRDYKEQYSTWKIESFSSSTIKLMDVSIVRYI